MEHLEIAYDLLVIMLGFAALSIAVSWALRTGETDLRNFCVLNGLFTGMMVLTVVKKYLLLNVVGYSPWAWYFISGILQALTFAVVVAFIHFLVGAYHIRARRLISAAFLLLMVVSDALMFTPVGATLDAQHRIIHLGIGGQIASLSYLAAFTFGILLGYGWLYRVWKTEKRSFVIGLLVFATVGYLESLVGLLLSIHGPFVSTPGSERDFLYSSIPYALYCIFVIVYFVSYFVPASVEIDQVFEAFLAKYGITEREREIILKVVQGKSNADIARELVVSIATVKTHLHNIYTTIGVNSRYNLLARVRSGQ